MPTATVVPIPCACGFRRPSMPSTRRLQTSAARRYCAEQQNAACVFSSTPRADLLDGTGLASTILQTAPGDSMRTDYNPQASCRVEFVQVAAMERICYRNSWLALREMRKAVLKMC